MKYIASYGDGGVVSRSVFQSRAPLARVHVSLSKTLNPELLPVAVSNVYEC